MATDPNLIDMGLPPEYAALLEQAQTRQGLAQALLKRSLEGNQLQQTGPVATKLSPWAIAANGLAGGLANMSIEDSRREQQGIKQKFSDAQTAAVQDYLSKPVGVRVTAGLSSQFPMIQVLAKKEAENQQKQFDSVLTSVGRVNPNFSVGMARTNQLPTEQIPMPSKEVNGQLVDPTARGDFRTTFEPPVITKPGNGMQPILTQRSAVGKVDAIDKAPKISLSNTSITKGEDEFLKTLGKNNAGAYETTRTDANTAYTTKATVQQMQDLDAKGVFSAGPGTPAVVALAGIAKALNMPVDTAKLANSEAFQQQFAKKIADVMLTGSVGRSMTDPDRKRFEETLPNLIQSPQGRQQIYAQLNSAADMAIKRHKAFQENLTTAYPKEKLAITMNPVDDTVGAPGVPANSPSVNPGMSSGKTIARTGKDESGRKVIQYSDGSWEYGR